MYFAKSLTIILFCIQYYYTRKSEQRIKQKEKQKVINSKKKIIIHNSILIPIAFFILLFVFDSLSNITFTMMKESQYSSFIPISSKILIIPILSGLCMIIFKYKIYKHQILAYVIITVGLLSYTIIEIIHNWIDFKMSIPLLLIVTLYLVCLFQDVIEKYLMQYKFINPFLIISIEGFIGLLFTSCSFIILNKIDCSENSLLCDSNSTTNHSYENFFESITLLLKHNQYCIGLFLYFIGTFAYNLCRIKTNDAYCPIHRNISDLICFYLGLILKFVIPFYRNDIVMIYVILQGLSYIIIIIGILIYFDILIIQCFDFSNNTSSIIQIRAEMENYFLAPQLKMNQMSIESASWDIIEEGTAFR